MLKMNQMQNYSYDEAHCGYGDSREAVVDVAGNGYEIAAAELFQAHQDQMLRNSGIGAGGFSWADDFADVHSANFAGMNTSGMVATRSWGSPREDFATVVGNNRHAVSSFDFINVIPANRVFLDGVRNGYALIEDRNFGSENNKVNNAAKAGRPDKGYDAAGESTAEPILNIQSGYQSQHNASADGAGFGAEDFGIAHAAILAQEGGVNV
jgi:hypothetical protein